MALLAESKLAKRGNQHRSDQNDPGDHMVLRRTCHSARRRLLAAVNCARQRQQCRGCSHFVTAQECELSAMLGHSVTRIQRPKAAFWSARAGGRGRARDLYQNTLEYARDKQQVSG